MDKSSLERCIQCRLVIQDCICRDVSAFWAEHKITLLTSKREERIISNTGRLLRWMLGNITAVYVGRKGWEKEVESEISRTDHTPVILFPTPPVYHAVMLGSDLEYRIYKWGQGSPFIYQLSESFCSCQAYLTRSFSISSSVNFNCLNDRDRCTPEVFRCLTR